MGYDKHQARTSGWRVPENNLIFVSLLGGGLGGLISRKVFHHKTRKKKFTIGFAAGVLVDLILIYFFPLRSRRCRLKERKLKSF